MILRYLGAQATVGSTPATIRLRVQNKPQGFGVVHQMTAAVDLLDLVPEEILASPHTTVALTASRDGGTVPLVPAFKLAWTKRAAHVRGWVEKGALPPEMDYAEAVRAVVRCFFFETDQTHRVVRNLRRVIFDVVANGGRPSALDRVARLLEDVFDVAAGVVANSPCMNYLFDLHMMVRYLQFQKNHPRRATQRRSTAGALRGIGSEGERFTAALAVLEEHCRAFVPLGTSHLHLGHLASYRGERVRAAAAYASARSAFEEVLDPSTATYPINTYVVPPAADDGSVLAPRLKWLQTSLPGPSSRDFPVILYSANPRFLKRYFPQLAFNMALFPEFAYHVHVVAEQDEALATMDLCTDLLGLVLRMRDQPEDAVTVDWSSSGVPDGVAQDKTYFAAARYLVAPELLDFYGCDIWIQDADLLPTGDIRLVPARTQEADVVLPTVQRLNGIVPWRRYLAGNVLIRQTDNGRAFLEATIRYLRSSLDRDNSWRLNQNALTYAMEAAPESTTVFNAAAVPAPLTPGRVQALVDA
ncbi:hypothetical protein [Kocuria sp. U4B]